MRTSNRPDQLRWSSILLGTAFDLTRRDAAHQGKMTTDQPSGRNGCLNPRRPQDPRIRVFGNYPSHIPRFVISSWTRRESMGWTTHMACWSALQGQGHLSRLASYEKKTVKRRGLSCASELSHRYLRFQMYLCGRRGTNCIFGEKGREGER